MKRVGLYGKPDYEYDRGRDLTPEEWSIFVDRAYWEMMDGAKIIMGRDLVEINKDLAKPPEPEKEEDDNYNPYDPISTRLHNMKQQKKEYEANMNFFRYVSRNKMTDEEFNSWWFGTPMMNQTTQQTEAQNLMARERWAREMHNRHMERLSTFQPLDPIKERDYANAVMYNAINQFTQGSVTQDMSLEDFMANLYFLKTRMSLMEIDEQRRQAEKEASLKTNQYAYQQALQNFANYGPGWMTADPRTPSNGQVVDLNAMLQTPQFKQFEDHCLNSKGHVQLSAVYR